MRTRIVSSAASRSLGSAPRIGAAIRNSLSLRCAAAWRTAGEFDGALRLPPLGTEKRNRVSPISDFTRSTRQPELFRRDDREHRARAGADILRADCAPRREPSRCAIACASGPDTADRMPLGRRDADSALDRAAGFRRFIFFRPSECARADFIFGRTHRVVAVAAPELEAIDSRLARHLVHRELQRKASLRPSGRTHRRRRAGVRIDVGFLRPDIRASIDRLERPRAARAAADSAAAALDQVDRGQPTVAIDAEPDLLLRVGTIACRARLVAAREHHFDRNAGRPGATAPRP